MKAGRRRGLIAAGSVAGHALVVALLVGLSPTPPAPVADPPIIVQLVTPAPPEPPPPPVPKPDPAPPEPPARKLSRPAKAVPTVTPILALAGPVSRGESEVSDAELAGAQTSGSGGGDGGRACNMPRFLEGKLRKDRRVQAAMAEARLDGAVRVWNGGWVRHGDQEGAGLASVREAIMWEVAFAPEACRREPVRGLVVLALSDGPGGARVALGAGAWRWTDLLGARARR